MVCCMDVPGVLVGLTEIAVALAGFTGVVVGVTGVAAGADTTCADF